MDYQWKQGFYEYPIMLDDSENFRTLITSAVFLVIFDSH